MQERLTRRERKNQTRERLIDAAIRVFAERGYQSATLDEVAAAAGFTKGAVYSNFASKEELFVALIERRIEVQMRMLAGRLEATEGRDGGAGSSDPEAERQWVVLAVEVWLQAMRDERVRQLMADQYRRARTITASIIAAAYERSGEEPPMPVRDLAIVIESLGVGIAFQAYLDPDDVRTTVQAEALALLGVDMSRWLPPPSEG
ncbi:MAG: TetR/AcrR family transcriptional regulator [Candidatus Limnocylindrales bacterium]